MQEVAAFSGGCQWGAIRYSVSAGPVKTNVCFCSMCKKATGSEVPSFISVPKARVTWIGEPAVFTSSKIATRGFCPACGTPLYYSGNESTTWGIAAGTADVTVKPDIVFYYDQHPEWLPSWEELPKADFDAAACSGDQRSNK